MADDSDHLLSELSDSAFDLPALEFEEEDLNLDEAIVPALVKEKRDIMIEVDENFKKVITLNNDQQDLKTLFRLALYTDPTCRHYSYKPFKFQHFSDKFDAWVDFDYDDVPNLDDGTHLKAIFRSDERRKHSKHKRKSKRRDSSPHERRRKKKKKSSSKRHRYSSGDEYEVRKYKRTRRSYSSDTKRSRRSYSSDSRRSRSSCSSDEGRSYVSRRVKDESNNTPCRVHNQHHKDSYYATRYKHCAISSTTLTVSSTNYVVSQVKSEPCDAYEEENTYNDNEVKEDYHEPATQGELYALTLGLEGKNPVSALYELCAKLQYGPPIFETLQEGVAPDPKFLMQVTVKGKTYVPEEVSARKKDAKKEAAECCLKQMGIYI